MKSPASVLSQVTLGYSPMIDRDRAVVATRLTIAPLRPESPPTAQALLSALAECSPEGAGKLSLNVINEALLLDLLQPRAGASPMLEVPAFMAGDIAHSESISRAHGRGIVLLLQGRPRSEIARALLPCFAHAIIDIADERRRVGPAPPGVTRRITHIQSGVQSLADMEASFQRGAWAVLGWPIDEVARARATEPRPDRGAVMALMHRLQAGEPLERLEAVLRLDATLIYELLRHLHAPGRGLGLEAASLAHALRVLGHDALLRWLAPLAAAPGGELDRRPALFAALRRGLIVRGLLRESIPAADEAQLGEAFLCGAFSLLDRMLGRPYHDLFADVPLPEGVHQALLAGGGPWFALLEVARALEGESMFDIRDAAERALLGQAEVNRALLGALAEAARPG
jgi:c-di-GMP phosphodiesterase